MCALLFKKINENIRQEQKQEMIDYYDETAQLFQKFQAQFEEFAETNLHKINKDTELRMNFNELCTELNIDPLSSSSSIFSKLLGDYYYRLAIKLINYLEQSKLSRILVKDFINYFNTKLTQQNRINAKDVEQAVKILNELSPGFKIIKQGGHDVLIFIDAEELLCDQGLEQVINHCISNNRAVIDRSCIATILDGDRAEADRVIEQLVNRKIVAVDNEDSGGWEDPKYYIISLYEGQTE